MVPHTCPRKVTSMARRKSSGLVSERGEKLVVMALLIQTSSGPSSSSTLRCGTIHFVIVGYVGRHDKGTGTFRSNLGRGSSRPARPRAEAARRQIPDPPVRPRSLGPRRLTRAGDEPRSSG